jgi:hypothetical protein
VAETPKIAFMKLDHQQNALHPDTATLSNPAPYIRIL